MIKLIPKENLSPQEICSQYREALREVYGEPIAKASQVYYAAGWFYINVARRFEDKSIGVGGVLPSCYRRKAVTLMIIELYKRADDKAGRK